MLNDWRDWNTVPKANDAVICILLPSGRTDEAKWSQDRGAWLVPYSGKWLSMDWKYNRIKPISWCPKP